MADFRKLGKGVTGALTQANEMAKVKRLAGNDVASQAISKAAESAGMNAPVTANKNLTTLQDFHTSLGDAVRQRAAQMQDLRDSLPYKYDAGHHVFTEDSARKNFPPLKILHRDLSGNKIMREDPDDFFSKKIIDPETGKAMRTPYEPGYKVRLEHSPDNWSEFVIPESAIKGSVDMANGGAIRMADGGSSGYHPDVQEALKAGRITPNQAKWMNNYAKTAGNPEIGTAGIVDGISEKMMNYRNAVRAGEHTRPNWMEPIPKDVKMPSWFNGKVDLDREGLRQLDKIPAMTKKAFNASEYSNTYPAGVNDVNYYNELLKASKEAPDYQPYIDEMNKLKERNPDIGKADGGKIAKGVMGALTKAEEIARARKAADMAPTARINLPAPNILIPSKMNNVREAVRNMKGNYGARRVERAADEIPNLEKMYQEDALKEAFTGDNARGVMTMNPAEFENYAAQLHKTNRRPQYASLEDRMRTGELYKEDLPTDEYIKHLQQVGGFSDVPYLNLFKDEVGLPTKASIVGHEGRHRNRALADKGQTAALVQVNPRGDLREGMPRRTQEDFIEALKKELDSANRLVLPEEYFDNIAQKEIKRPPVELPDIYADGGGVKHMADAGRVTKGVMGALSKAKELAQAKKASESKIAEVLEAKQAPMTRPQGTGLPLMPRDNGMYTLREQTDLPRMPMVDKAREAGVQPKYNERMQDLLDSPKARKKIDNLINKGKELNVQEWYGTEPLRQVALDAGRTPEQFESLMAQLASASQRNPVDKQNQMGSYLYHLSETGQLPENALLLTNKLKKELKADPSLAEGRTLIELPKGYGSLAQGDIFNRAVQIGQGDIGGALPPNKKLGTFYENLLGNLKPVTVDVNALRGPIIEQGDPRWLTSKLVEKDETGKVINSYKPREMYNTGEMTMREAQQRPGFWEAAPSGSEYAGFEDLWQRGAKRHGVEPAEAQALGWYGSADVTALKTKPENYVDNLERLIKRTAEQTGKSPSEVMNDLVTGQGFLRKDGGAVERKETPEEMARFHKRFALHKATGGKVAIPHLSLKNPKRMADGGSSSEPTAREIAEQLGKLAAQQGKEEVESYKKPRAATDIGNRGILAPALGAPVDLMNMGLMGIDSVSQAIGKPTRLSSEKPFGGSEHLKDLMDKYGVTSGEDRPMTETALSLFSPTGMVKGAMGVTKGAMKAADAMRKPVSGLGAMRAKAN